MSPSFFPSQVIVDLMMSYHAPDSCDFIVAFSIRGRRVLAGAAFWISRAPHFQKKCARWTEVECDRKKYTPNLIKRQGNSDFTGRYARQGAF